MLVVIFVLGIGLIGALSFFNINLNNQFEAKNELIAAGLAQEGADLVRNIVDHSYLNGLPWYEDIYQDNANYCHGIDRDILFDAASAKCYKKVTKKVKETAICFDPTKAVYVHPDKNKTCENLSLQSTGFSRTVVISGYDANGGGVDLDAGDCLSVVASVTWNDRETKSTDIICKPRQ